MEKDTSALPPAQRPALVGANGTAQEVRSAPCDQQANLIESAAPAVPAVGGLTEHDELRAIIEGIRDGAREFGFAGTYSQCDRALLLMEALATKAEPVGHVVTWNKGGSGERNDIEPIGKSGYSLAESLPEGTMIYTSAPLATRAPADLSGLTRYDHRGALMEPDQTGDYLLISDVRDLLATKAEPTKAEGGEAVGEVVACEDYGTTIRWSTAVPRIGTKLYTGPALPGEAAAPDQPYTPPADHEAREEQADNANPAQPSPVLANDVQGERLRARVLEMWTEYERHGETCQFEGNPMIYASSLEELVEIARATATPSPVSASERVPEDRDARIAQALGLLKQDYSPECLRMASVRSYVEDAVGTLIDAGYVPPVPAHTTAGFKGTISAGEWDRDNHILFVTVKLPIDGLPIELKTLGATATIAAGTVPPVPAPSNQERYAALSEVIAMCKFAKEKVATAREEACVQAIMDEVNRLRAAPSTPPSTSVPQGWISVDERLPELGQTVLAFSPGYGQRETTFDRWPQGSINRMKYGDEAGYFQWDEPQSHWTSSWKPTHWQPRAAAPALR